MTTKDAACPSLAGSPVATRKLVAIVVGAGTILTIIVVLGIVLARIGVAVGFSTLRSNLDQGLRLSLTTWGGGIVLFASAVGGWAAARTGRVRGAGAGAAIGFVTSMVAVVVASVIAWAILRPSADFLSAVVEFGAVAAAETDPAAAGASNARTIAYGPQFIEATTQATVYLAVVLLLVMGAATLGGIIGTSARPQ